MRRHVLLGSVVAIAATAFATLAGCGQGDAETGTPELESTSSLDQAIRSDVTRAARLAAVCGKHGGAAVDPACVAKELKQASRSPGIAALEKQVGRVSHAQICSIARTTDRVFYVQGGLTGATEPESFATGIERVWDLRNREAATFAYAKGGAGSLLAADADAYAGFVLGPRDGNLLSAWNGRSFAAAGEGATTVLASAETSKLAIGSDDGKLRGRIGSMPSREALSRVVLNGIAERVDEKMLAGGTRANEALTKAMSVYGPAERTKADGNGSVVMIAGDALVGAGVATALHILALSDGQPGSFPAALAAVVFDKTSGVDLGAYCAGISDRGSAVRTFGGVKPTADGVVEDGVDEVDVFGSTETVKSPEETGECALVDGACETLFPGKGYVCSSNGAAGTCCRKPFEPKDVCYSDNDCAAGQICAQGKKAAESGEPVFGCIDPADPSTACMGGGPRAALPRMDSEITLAAFIPCAGLGSRLLGCFTGDNRGYDYNRSMTASRLAARVTVQTDGRSSTEKYVGATHSVACGDLEGPVNCSTMRAGAAVTECGTASSSSVSTSVTAVGARMKVRIVFSGKNPCVTGAPAIDGLMDVFIDYGQENGVKVPAAYSWSGYHEFFPAWELYINGHGKHGYDPVAAGYGPDALISGAPRFAGTNKVSGTAGH